MKHAMSYLCAALALGACSKNSNNGGNNTQPKSANVTTLAGSGSTGWADGSGSSANFNQPAGLAMDASGNLFVADANNNCIRKVTPDGNVSTFAGSTTPGHKDGQGTAAEFYGPNGIAIDKSGNVYVSETAYSIIRKISPSGAVTTFAGGTEGYLDGTGTSAEFESPFALAIDNEGNIIVADAYNHRIRKITPAGVVTTIAGSGATGPGNGGFADGPAASAQFKAPSGLFIDASDNIYVADQGNNRIRKISGGVVTTIAGTGATGTEDGPVSSAELAAPENILADAQGDLFECDHAAIREISHGTVTTIAGSTEGSTGFADGVGTAALFNGPNGIVMDASGNLYVVDQFNNALRKITFK